MSTFIITGVTEFDPSSRNLTAEDYVNMVAHAKKTLEEEINPTVICNGLSWAGWIGMEPSVPAREKQCYLPGESDEGGNTSFGDPIERIFTVHHRVFRATTHKFSSFTEDLRAYRHTGQRYCYSYRGFELSNKRMFSDWVRSTILVYDFLEGRNSVCKSTKCLVERPDQWRHHIINIDIPSLR
jgi:hypothetical protein